ncbi:hypothetical protein OBP_269 [Pseudomonas phage OBP]|uniref:hypothetical protein n=1 Tax=Pseudomonas phage OBP TaxID=1124849 RepID=UPI000240D5F6|nr:hypothetical protein OBP_269 [Pseudomonas phage OBP]AEV89706.1 hypothetical protein OBP_269 [Pseudomonas phage OBP]
MEEKDPIVLLLNYMASELHTEVIINRDSTDFWEKAQDYIFDNSLVSFREGIDTLSEAIKKEKDMYNYLSALVFRTFAQPFTLTALKQFADGFDATASDPILGGFNFTAAKLTNIEKLMLFFTVHRNKITIALFERDELINLEKKSKGKSSR